MGQEITFLGEDFYNMTINLNVQQISHEFVKEEKSEMT